MPSYARANPVTAQEAPVYHSPYADVDGHDPIRSKHPNPTSTSNGSLQPANSQRNNHADHEASPNVTATDKISQTRRRKTKKLKPEQIVYYVGKHPRRLPRGNPVPQSASGPAAASGSRGRRATVNTQTTDWLAAPKFFDGPLLPAYPQNPNLPPPPGFMPPPPPGYVIRGYIPPPEAAGSGTAATGMPDTGAMPGPTKPLLVPPGPGKPMDPKFRAAYTGDARAPRAIAPRLDTQSASAPGPDPDETTMYLPQRYQPPQGFQQVTQHAAPQNQYQYIPPVPSSPVHIPATAVLMAARQRGDPPYTTQHEWVQRKDPGQASEGVLATYVALDVIGCKSCLLHPYCKKQKWSNKSHSREGC